MSKLLMVMDEDKLFRYDFGNQINFKLYKQTGFTKLDVTAFDATGWTAGVIKSFKRHGDRAFFFRDVARALTVVGQLAQVIQDIPIVWDNQALGQGHFSYTDADRPTIPGYLHLECELTKTGSQISSEKVRISVDASEGA